MHDWMTLQQLLEEFLLVTETEKRQAVEDRLKQFQETFGGMYNNPRHLKPFLYLIAKSVSPWFRDGSTWTWQLQEGFPS